MPPEVALPAAIQGASAAFSVCWGPHPAALLWFNDVYGQPDIGVVSMVATEELEEHSIEFLRRGRELLPSFFTRYQILTNHVDERNQLHIKWLRWLGFSLLRRTTSWSVDGTPFIEFARLAPCA